MEFRLKTKVVLMDSSDSTIRQEGQHLTPEQMRDYQRRALAGDELASLYRHLGECGSCRRTLRAEMGQMQIPAEALAIPEPLHLDYEDLVSYMDRKADPAARERAEAHLFLCGACSRELEGLENLERQLSAVEAPAALAKEPAAKRASMRDRVVRLFTVPGIGRQLAYGSAAVLAGILVLYRPGMGTGPEGAARGLARVLAPTAQPASGVGLGGIVLVGGGIAYLLYVLFKNR